MSGESEKTEREFDVSVLPTDARKRIDLVVELWERDLISRESALSLMSIADGVTS